MSKKAAQPKTESAEKPEKGIAPENQMLLKVGINFTLEGSDKETSVEPGVIDATTIPEPFRNELIERGLLVIE